MERLGGIKICLQWWIQHHKSHRKPEKTHPMAEDTYLSWVDSSGSVNVGKTNLYLDGRHGILIWKRHPSTSGPLFHHSQDTFAPKSTR